MPPVSLRQIAEQAGVSRMTVSCALRNSPRVKPETAIRIWRLAQELGYSPDPKMTEAMARVRGAKKKELQPLAWINAQGDKNAYRNYKWLSPYMEGARERCAELGYRVDEFWLKEPGMTESRLSSIIQNRGIRGVIVGQSQPSITHLKLNWKHLASISQEGAIQAPRLHLVVPDHHYNLMLALQSLRQLGYRRIGLLLHQIIEHRSHHAYLAAYHYFQSLLPTRERVPPLIFDPLSIRQIKQWLKQAKPDAIIGHHARLLDWLTTAGVSVPDDIGVAHLAIDDDCADWAGIWQNKRLIGAQSIELVVSMLLNNRLGLPDIPFETLIPGEWRFGKTLLNKAAK
jgi:LacI family transcriptional regulator